MARTGRTLLEGLGQLWLVVNGAGEAMPVISPVHLDGLASPIYTHRAGAEAATGYYPDLGPFQSAPAPELWRVARLLAGQGIAGLLLDEQLPIHFFTTEPGSRLPTHLGLLDDEGWLYLGEQGIEEALDGARPWVDLVGFDRLAIRWMLADERPFAGYTPEGTLWSYEPEGIPHLTGERGLLLEQADAPTRAIALFRSATSAAWFWRSSLGVELDPEDSALVEIHDVRGWLDEATELRSGAVPLLNPGLQRYYQGFFRQVDGAWVLVTINGIWLLASPFELRQLARRS